MIGNKDNMEKKEIHTLIYFLTHNKSLSKAQQSKRDALIARDYSSNLVEIGDIPKVESITRDRIEKIRLTNRDNTKVDFRNKYISPKYLQLFLKEFNQDEILKYTCHEIDTDETAREICEMCETEEYSVKKHSELIAKAFENLNKKLINKKIFKDPKMYALISVYLTGITSNGQKQWSSLNIDTNWSCSELFDWGERNPGIIPSPGRNIARKQRNPGYELPHALLSNLTGTRILSFRELVLYFKSLFHIRRDNSLKDILCYINETEKYKDKNISISFSDSDFKNNIELFADVDKLVQAYKHIIELCKDCHKNEENINVELSFYERDGYIYFCIHDLDSVYGKNLAAATTRIGERQKPIIKNQINGLCDLLIEADFDNKEFARITLWGENSNLLTDNPNILVEKLEKCHGVKYILRFPRI